MNLIRRADGSFSLPTVRERERLHDYETDHTLPAVKSSAAKHQPNLAFAVRASIIGDTYQCMSVSVLLSHLAHDWGYLSRPVRPSEIRSRLADHLRIVDVNRVRGGSTDELACSPAEQLVRRTMARCTGRGSDVRRVTGDLLSPQKISRQSLDGRFWRWKTVIANNWKFQSHMNVLELEAIALELQRRVRDPRNHCCKYLHLVDSQVALACMSKRRGTSRVLQRVLRRANALSLASGTIPVFCFIRSEHNPADAPSRRGRFVRNAKVKNKGRQLRGGAEEESCSSEESKEPTIGSFSGGSIRQSCPILRLGHAEALWFCCMVEF